MKSKHSKSKVKNETITTKDMYRAATQSAFIRLMMISLETLTKEPYNWKKKRLQAFVDNLIGTLNTIDLSGSEGELLVYMKDVYGIDLFAGGENDES